MKILSLLILLFLVAALPLSSVGSDQKPAACCPADVQPDSAAPFTDASIYNLDSNWTNDLARPVQLASFRGKPVAVAMFFAHCDYACPVLVHDLRRIEQALPETSRDLVQFVLVTFDVERDTPEVLARYGQASSLGENWTLLRGSQENVQELAALLGVKYKQNGRGLFDHSNLISLLDPEGEVVAQQIGLNRDPESSALTLQKLVKPAGTNDSPDAAP